MRCNSPEADLTADTQLHSHKIDSCLKLSSSLVLRGLSDLYGISSTSKSAHTTAL